MFVIRWGASGYVLGIYFDPAAGLGVTLTADRRFAFRWAEQGVAVDVSERLFREGALRGVVESV